MCLFCTCTEDANQSKMDSGTREMVQVDLSSNSYYSHKCQARHHRPVNPALEAQQKWILKSLHRSVSLAGKISFLFSQRPCFQGNKAVSNRERHLMSFYGLHVSDHSYTHVHTLYTHICPHPHTGGELGVGWRSVCLGISALCCILLLGRYHEVVNRPLKRGGVGDEGWGQWSSWGKDLVISPKRQFLLDSLQKQNGCCGVGRYKAAKIFYLENCYPSLTNLETSLVGGGILNK